MVYPAQGTIYWANFGSNTIGVANLDGSESEVFETGTAPIDGARGLAIDPFAGVAVWANEASNSIGYADLDGSGAGGELDTGAATLNHPAYPILLEKPKPAPQADYVVTQPFGSNMSCPYFFGPDLPESFLFIAPRTVTLRLEPRRHPDPWCRRPDLEVDRGRQLLLPGDRHQRGRVDHGGQSVRDHPEAARQLGRRGASAGGRGTGQGDA